MVYRYQVVKVCEVAAATGRFACESYSSWPCCRFSWGPLPPGITSSARSRSAAKGGWDYLTVDSAARRLYVSHATHVVVVDLDANKVVGDIPDTPGVHGIAIAPELNRGFVSNGRGNNVTIFDLKTLKAIGTAATGENPDSIRYDAVSGRVFTFNGRSKKRDRD